MYFELKDENVQSSVLQAKVVLFVFGFFFLTVSETCLQKWDMLLFVLHMVCTAVGWFVKYSWE